MTTGLKENNEIRLWSTRDKNIEEQLPHLWLNSDESIMTPMRTAGFDSPFNLPYPLYYPCSSIDDT